MIWRRETGAGGPCGGYSVAQVRPHVAGYPVRAVPLAASLKEGCRVKGGFGGVWRLDWACVTGVFCFPDSCHVRGERPGGSRTGRSPAARGGAGGVLEATGREPDDLAAGNGSRGAVRGIFGCSGPSPCTGLSGAGSAAGCSHPFAPVPGRGRGAWG